MQLLWKTVVIAHVTGDTRAVRARGVTDVSHTCVGTQARGASRRSAVVSRSGKRCKTLLAREVAGKL